MTLVVADTGPICYLILVDAISLLPKLYDRIVLPTEVIEELKDAKAPDVVRRWTNNPPTWVEMRKPLNQQKQTELEKTLDVGEAAAIAIALELAADRILIDDLSARRIAVSRGLTIAGTIRVLEEAAATGLLDLKVTFDKLRRTTFRADPDLIEQALARDAIRRKR